MDCNRKVKLLVSEIFWRGREVQKGHFCFGPSFIKCILAAKQIYLDFYNSILKFVFLYMWQRDRPVTGSDTAPQSWVTFWPKFKRPQNFRGCWGKFSGVRYWSLLRCVTDDPHSGPPFTPKNFWGGFEFWNFAPLLLKIWSSNFNFALPPEAGPYRQQTDNSVW